MDSSPAANARKGARRHSQRKQKSNTNNFIAIALFGGIVGVGIGLLILYPDIPLSEAPAVDPQFIESANGAGLTFTSLANTYFTNWSLEDAQKAAQNSFSPTAKGLSPCASYMSQGVLLPEAYDLRQEFPHCMEPVQLQGNCSSAYAIASSSVLSERFCLETNGLLSVKLSAQDLISCDQSNGNCQGGFLDGAWSYIKEEGIVDDECFTYDSYDFEYAECDKKCESSKRYRASEICITAGEEPVMREIKAKGPVVALLPLYSDFLTYSSGVYQPYIASTKLQAQQAVEIVGWGTDSATQKAYWIVKNSWGPDWGENGYARVARGVTEFQIDEVVVTGSPFVTSELTREDPGVDEVDLDLDQEAQIEQEEMLRKEREREEEIQRQEEEMKKETGKKPGKKETGGQQQVINIDTTSGGEPKVTTSGIN